MSFGDEKEEVLRAYDLHEAMHILLSALCRAPTSHFLDDADDGEVDEELEDMRDDLVERGLLEVRSQGGRDYFTTTDAGIAALNRYINGDDDNGDSDDEEV